MTDLTNVETLSPPPTDAEVAWWNQHQRRKRWRGIALRFALGVSTFGIYVGIRWPSRAREPRWLDVLVAVVAGAVLALAPRPNTELFDEMTAAIRDRRVRDALRAPPHE